MRVKVRIEEIVEKALYDALEGHLDDLQQLRNVVDAAMFELSMIFEFFDSETEYLPLNDPRDFEDEDGGDFYDERPDLAELDELDEDPIDGDVRS